MRGEGEGGATGKMRRTGGQQEDERGVGRGAEMLRWYCAML